MSGKGSFCWGVCGWWSGFVLVAGVGLAVLGLSVVAGSGGLVLVAGVGGLDVVAGVVDLGCAAGVEGLDCVAGDGGCSGVVELVT